MGGFFNGLLDNFRLYDTALADEQILAEGTPVPEATTMLLLGSGLIGLVGLRRKFKKE